MLQTATLYTPSTTTIPDAKSPDSNSQMHPLIQTFKQNITYHVQGSP
jgi:hypothetical protein